MNNTIARKIVKFIIFALIAGAFISIDVKAGELTVMSVLAAFAIASVAYLIISFFGLMLFITRNYLLSIIPTIILILVVIFNLDKWIDAVPFLTDENVGYFMIVAAGLCVALDVRTIIKNVKGETIQLYIEDDEQAIQQMQPQQTVPSTHENMKNNPRYVLKISDILEKKLGRKPSYKEITDYIDLLEIPEDDDEF